MSPSPFVRVISSQHNQSIVLFSLIFVCLFFPVDRSRLPPQESRGLSFPFKYLKMSPFFCFVFVFFFFSVLREAEACYILTQGNGSASSSSCYPQRGCLCVRRHCLFDAAGQRDKRGILSSYKIDTNADTRSERQKGRERPPHGILIRH